MPPTDEEIAATTAAEAATAAATAAASSEEVVAATPPEGDTPDAPKQPTVVEQAVAAAKKAELTRVAQRLGIEGDFASADELEAAIDEATAADQEAAVEKQVGDQYATTLREVATGLKGIKFEGFDKAGAPIDYTLSDAQIQEAVTKKLDGLRPAIRKIEAQANYGVMAEAAYELFPSDETWETFGKEVEKGLSIRDWTHTLAEHLAPHTKAWKAQEAKHASALAAAKAEAWIEGNKAPPGAPTQDAGGAGGGTGKLTSAAFQRMTLDEQAKAWKERPEEVRAL